VLVPPGGMVETYDHGEVFSDECADPPIPAQNGIDTTYPEGEGEVGEVESLFDVARVWEERIERFLEREVESEILKDVQRQTMVSLGVVEEALRRWR